MVSQLTSGAGAGLEAAQDSVHAGNGGFRDAHTLEIDRVSGGKDTLQFEHAIIATGSRPSTIPGLSIDDPRVMNSTGALDLPDIPKTLLVVGGGYIGLELGQRLRRARQPKVTVVEMTDGLLPGADRDLVNILAKRIEAMCEAVLLNTKVVGMKDGGQRHRGDVRGRRRRSRVSGPSTACSSRSAAGRTPPCPGWIARASKSNRRGFIDVDESRRTDEPSIYAIGDVVGEPMLAHKASHEGRTAVDAIAGDRNVAFEPLAIPAVVFTDPELAWCGLTETDAEKQGRKVAVARFPWGASGRAITLGRTDGVTKLVLDPDTGRVLGVGIVGAGAGELISEGVLAIEMGATARDVAMTIHPHPTLTETVMEAAEVFFGTATHVYRPKRA